MYDEKQQDAEEVQTQQASGSEQAEPQESQAENGEEIGAAE